MIYLFFKISTNKIIYELFRGSFLYLILCHQTDYKPAYIKHRSSAFVEELYNKEGKHLDEEFLFMKISILTKRSWMVITIKQKYYRKM